MDSPAQTGWKTTSTGKRGKKWGLVKAKGCSVFKVLKAGAMQGCGN